MVFHHLVTRDFDQIAQNAHAWDARFSPLTAGPFFGSISTLQVGPISCMHLETSQVMLCRGVLRRPATVLTPIVSGNCHANWRGHILQPSMVNHLGINNVMDHVTSRDYSTTSLIIDNQFLSQVACRQWDMNIVELLNHQVAIRPARAISQQMNQLLHQLFTSARQGETLEETEVVADTMDILFHAMVSLDDRLQDRPDGTTRQRIIQRVNEYLQSHPHQMVYVSDLCRVAYCSERTLQYAIHERYGVTPKKYLQHHRLNGVRLELKQCVPHRSMVGTISRRWGFRHPGEFAASYQKLFGELPSETAARYHGKSAMPSAGMGCNIELPN